MRAWGDEQEHTFSTLYYQSAGCDRYGMADTLKRRRTKGRNGMLGFSMKLYCSCRDSGRLSARRQCMGGRDRNANRLLYQHTALVRSSKSQIASNSSYRAVEDDRHAQPNLSRSVKSYSIWHPFWGPRFRRPTHTLSLPRKV